MEIERRGKYPGVKVHLDPEEIALIATLATWLGPEISGSMQQFTKQPVKKGAKLVIKLHEKIADAMQEDPALLQPRTKEEIRATLEKERDSAIKKLAAMDDGKEWHLGKPKGQDTFTG